MKYMENATSWLIRVTMYAHVTYNSIHMNVRKETILYTCGNNRIYLHILHLSIMIINKIVFISIHQFSKKKKGLCDISMPRWDSMHTATFLKGGKMSQRPFFVGNVGVIQIILSSNKKSCSFSHCLFHLFYMFPKNRDQFYDKSFLHVNAAQNVGAATPPLPNAYVP